MCSLKLESKLLYLYVHSLHSSSLSKSTCVTHRQRKKRNVLIIKHCQPHCQQLILERHCKFTVLLFMKKRYILISPSNLIQKLSFIALFHDIFIALSLSFSLSLSLSLSHSLSCFFPYTVSTLYTSRKILHWYLPSHRLNSSNSKIFFLLPTL